jgi:hypothetical protein
MFISSNVFASGVMDNIVSQANYLVQLDQSKTYPLKFIAMLFSYYVETYKKKKIVPGHVNMAQRTQA